MRNAIKIIMKLIELNIEGKKIEVRSTIYGKEEVLVDDNLVSRKNNFFATNHIIKINGTTYKLTYRVKDAWKKITGKPVIQISSGDTLLSEVYIKNRSFITMQFIIGFITTYCIYSVFIMLLNTAKNGYIYYAY